MGAAVSASGGERGGEESLPATVLGGEERGGEGRVGARGCGESGAARYCALLMVVDSPPSTLRKKKKPKLRELRHLERSVCVLS
ncbi:hypothetical protein E2C01_069154 [Portunus trituberculatus]|uniref:Uncharacterized protein n=1 Tax=Portunus trituberculatus TaxID=210409 RepID=A0A5B7HYM2_PORTR|nr:hypothetical protein [Portunus trituberculatus]